MTILLHRYRVFNYYGKLGRYCTFCRGGIFEKRESELSSRFRASTVPHRRYRLEPVFRTKLCKTGTQQVPSRVPRYYYILVSKGSGIGVFGSYLKITENSLELKASPHSLSFVITIVKGYSIHCLFVLCNLYILNITSYRSQVIYRCTGFSETE